MINLRSKSVLWSVSASARTLVLSGQHSGVISSCITSSHVFSHLVVRSALLPLLVVSVVAVTCKEQQTAVRRTSFIFTEEADRLLSWAMNTRKPLNTRFSFWEKCTFELFVILYLNCSTFTTKSLRQINYGLKHVPIRLNWNQLDYYNFI